MSRDLDREQAWLTQAADGDRSGWAAHAVARLNAGEREYGNAWVGRPAHLLVAEMAEEAADLGGWGALVMQALDGTALEGSDRDLAEALLTVAATQAAKAHANITALFKLTASKGGQV